MAPIPQKIRTSSAPKAQVRRNSEAQLNTTPTASPVDSYQPSGNSGTDRLLVEYRRLAKEQNRTPIYQNNNGYTNKEAILPDDWRVESLGPNHTSIRNNASDLPSFKVDLKKNKPSPKKLPREEKPSSREPEQLPSRPTPPIQTGRVKSSTVVSRDIPSSGSKDIYPPNHPAMRAELSQNTTEAAVYAAKNTDFRQEWLNQKMASEWDYENEDFKNFNKGACGAQLHLSEDVLLSNGYREGYGYGDTKLSDRASRMIRKGYAYGSRGKK